MKKNYKYFLLIATLVVGVLSLISYQAITYTGGPSGGLTNAPGENSCTSCHSGSLITSGTNWGNISLTTDIPGTGYIPDSVYTITLAQSVSGIGKWGFQITCLAASNNSMAGSFTITNSTRTQKVTASSKEYVTHTSSGTSGSGSNSWSFSWKAPSSNLGDVKFYATTNAANGNNMTSGDQIFAKNWTFSISSLLPTASISPSKTSICVGDTLFLTGGGNNNPTSYSWTLTGGTPSSSTTQNPWVVYNSSGSKTITLTTTNNKGKSSPATVNITVNSLPSTNITITGKTTLCSGDSVVLTAPQGTNFSYLWNTTETSRSIIVKKAGNYFVTVTNASGCKATSQTIKVVVNSVNANKITLSADSICSGDLLILTSTAGFSTYTFYNGKTAIYNGNNHSFSTKNIAKGNDLYSIAVDSNGCSSISNKTSVVVDNPSKATTISCKKVTTNSIEFEWQLINGALAYEVSTDTGKNWKNNGLLNTYIVSGLNYSTDVHLSVRAIEKTKCKYSETATKICQTLPCSPINFVLNIDSIICLGDSALIAVKNIDISSYAINFNNTGYSKDTIFYVKPSSSIVYSIMILDSNALNCPPIQKNIQIKVENLPVVLSNDASNNSICDGKSILFKSTQGFANYEYFVNSKSVVSGISPDYQTSSLKNNDEVYVVATSKLGCDYNSIKQKITVFDKPDVMLSSNKMNNEVCKGGDIQLSANSGFSYYAFVINGTDTFSSGKMDKANYNGINNASTFAVYVTDSNGCSAKSDDLSVKINDLPNPGFTFIQNKLEVTFSDTTANSASRKWDFGDLTSDTSKSPVHTYNIAGDYTIKLTVTDKNTCSSSTQKSVKVSNSSVNAQNLNQKYFVAYMNQSGKNLIYEFNLTESTEVNISIYNTNGQYVTTIKTGSYDKGNYKNSYPLSTLGKGVYYIVYKDSKLSKQEKIVIQ